MLPFFYISDMCGIYPSVVFTLLLSLRPCRALPPLCSNDTLNSYHAYEFIFLKVVYSRQTPAFIWSFDIALASPFNIFIYHIYIQYIDIQYIDILELINLKCYIRVGLWIIYWDQSDAPLYHHLSKTICYFVLPHLKRSQNSRYNFPNFKGTFPRAKYTTSNSEYIKWTIINSRDVYCVLDGVKTSAMNYILGSVWGPALSPPFKNNVRHPPPSS